MLGGVAAFSALNLLRKSGYFSRPLASRGISLQSLSNWGGSRGFPQGQCRAPWARPPEGVKQDAHRKGSAHSPEPTAVKRIKKGTARSAALGAGPGKPRK